MQIVHVVATSIHDSMGVTTALREIVSAQAAAGMDVRLLVQGGWPGPLDQRVRLVECGGRGFSRHLAKLAGAQGVIHSHVPWRMPALAPMLVRHRNRAFVHSPHGSFAAPAWNVHRTRKALAWHLLFGHAIRRHDLLVVNSAAEQVDVESMALGRPVVHVPHPITVPNPPIPTMQNGSKRVAFLGRIHPTKGVLELVRAWRKLDGTAAEWTLHIAGPVEDAAYAAEVRAAASGSGNIVFVPALFGAESRRFLAEADIVAVPSRSENFCYVVAEALAMGTPVLTTLGVPWPEIATTKLGWRGEGTVDGMARMLATAIGSNPAERLAMGARGRAHIEAEFSPQSVAQRYSGAYAQALDNSGAGEWAVQPAGRGAARE